MTVKIISNSESETLELGRELGKKILPGITVLLYGDLGTGKTVFVRGVGEAMQAHGVRSPSFTLINEYETKTGNFLIHSDLYRLDENGVRSLGIEEYERSGDSILFVEWAERWPNPPAENVIKIFFKALNENQREIKILFTGEKAEKIITDNEYFSDRLLP